MNTKEIALSYLNQGLSVIPVKSPQMVNPDATEKQRIDQCKIPLIAWKEYQNRLPTEEEVCQWFDEYPDANIGIVTGKVSDLVVFDLDSDHAVEFADENGGFPDTPKVKTGKGYHVYMRHPGFEIRNSVNKKLDIDIRADGGFVVAPPSVHGNGHHYIWESGFSISEIDPAGCEPWMIDYLKGIAEHAPSKKTDERRPERVEVGKFGSNSESNTIYAELLKNGCTEGMRNDSAAKLAGHWLAKGLPEEETWELLQQWNSKNQPPIDTSELRKTFESVRKLHNQNAKPASDEKEIDLFDLLDTPEKVTAEYDESYVRIPFSLKQLSNLEGKLNGGLVGGRLYVLGGIPSAGKTVVANNIADNVCLHSHPVLFFSYDDGRMELRYRTYSRFSDFDIENFNQKQATKTDLEAICKNRAVSRINANKYVVQHMIQVDDWPKIIDKIVKRHGKAPVIIVDYLRKLRTKNGSGDERLRVDGIMSMLTDLAKTYNTPVMVISELARDSYKSGQRLSMASFKESGSIEYEASWLGILAAVENNGNGYVLKNDWEQIINHDGNIDLIVFKAKRGTGETGKVSLKLDKKKMAVRDRIESSKVDTVNAMKKPSKFD
jgi:replicative DNA helicase